LYHATVQKKQIIFSCGGGVAVLTRQNLHADQACGLAAYIFYLRACAPLAALRPYIYMYELVELAAENGIDDPHAARRSIPPISLKLARSTSTRLARNLSDAHTRLTFLAACLKHPIKCFPSLNHSINRILWHIMS